jgi:hypothetical protein
MRILALLAAAGVLVAQAPPASTPQARLEQEIGRVRRDIARQGPEDQRAALETRLARAEEALAAGRIELALYDLEPAWEAADASKFIADAGKLASLDDFTALWKRSEHDLTAPPVAAPAAAAGGPVFAEALGAAAAARAPATYRASLPFAQDAGIDTGLYYLGDAYAAIHFAEFVHALGLPPSGTRPPFRSIAPDLDAFDRQVTAAYEHMERAQHPSYIRVSAAIKQARTLDAAKQYPAALVQYLLARYRFGLLHPPDAAEHALADAQQSLPPGADTSIARFFVQVADTAAASPDPETRGSAAVVAGDVLPAYAAALRAPAGNANDTPAAQVTITLVRWPFT